MLFRSPPLLDIADLSLHRYVLTIDCHQLCKNSRSEAKLVAVSRSADVLSAFSLIVYTTQELANSVGYFPQFVLGSSINNMIDLAAMGLIGQKAGFSASLDAQLKAVRPSNALAIPDLIWDVL